jgi:ubiquinone/menaquinone biosynthesis C-methylase UbiE/uncharacterized protein YbaR (Trm112 family)
MDGWLLDHLVCPRDKTRLTLKENHLFCAEKHSYPVIRDIPVLLVDDAVSTHGYIEKTLAEVAELENREPPSEPSGDEPEADTIDEFVQQEIPYTSGNLYFSVQNRLPRYPIPDFRPPPGNGERLLDIGCNWGRWTIAAAQKGYRAVGMDPSLEAVLAAQRVSRQLGVEPVFLVGDARFLPFADDAFDTVFSYSVFQHFSKENAKISFEEIARVLKRGNFSYLQMPNRYGVRQFYQHWKRGFTEGEGFEVRYWTPAELIETFEEKFGETEMSTDCFFGLGIQKTDTDLLPLHFKAVVYSSEILRGISRIFPPLTKVADSVYLVSKNRK